MWNDHQQGFINNVVWTLKILEQHQFLFLFFLVLTSFTIGNSCGSWSSPQLWILHWNISVNCKYTMHMESPNSQDSHSHISPKHMMYCVHSNNLQGIWSGGSHLILTCHGVNSWLFELVVIPSQWSHCVPTFTNTNGFPPFILKLLLFYATLQIMQFLKTSLLIHPLHPNKWQIQTITMKSFTSHNII
jgi:hypothetical protein